MKLECEFGITNAAPQVVFDKFAEAGRAAVPFGQLFSGVDGFIHW